MRQVTLPQFVEGSITMLLGALAWIFLPDFPDKNTFLRPKETAWVLERIEQDRGDSMPDSISCAIVLHHLWDWKLWAYGIYCASLLGVDGER